MTEVGSKRIGRPPLTDRASLIAAARRVGFATLTIGTVTAQVGVKHSTFYRHFSSFEELQTTMVDEVLSEADFEETAGPWREHLTRTSARMTDLLNANPGLAQAIMALPEHPPRLVELFRRSTEVMLTAGFDAPDAVLGASAAYDLAMTIWADTPEAAPRRSSRVRQARAASQLLPDSDNEALIDMIDGKPTRWVAARLDVVLDGLAARRHR